MRKPVVIFLAVPLCIILCTACSLKLAPEYNRSLADGLTGSAQSVMILLATVSGGTGKADYLQRAEKYNTLIGVMEALKIQAEARSAPAGKIVDRANAALAAKGIPVMAGKIPSAIALENIARNLVKMRDTDRAQGLTPVEVEVFRGNMIIYFDQAITYENFLRR